MRIAFYAPFKPLGHPRPSGDLTIATGLTDFLRREHDITVASRLRARWAYWKPWLWPRVALERIRTRRLASGADLWLTYHTYYKAPDLLGPGVAKSLGLPYVVFQGIYSTKRRKRLSTRPGFALNRRALLAADMVFCNKRQDHENLLRLLPDDRVRYVAPGIFPEQFCYDAQARETLRRDWNAGQTPVVLSAAMFRDDVKTRGLLYLLESLGSLKDADFRLCIAGDGPTRPRLEQAADTFLPGRVTFLGMVPRHELHKYYSAADVFAFPGFRESLGMVYLEAQSCGLPVVAFDGWGIPEVVANGHSGLLTPAPPLDGNDGRDESGKLAMAQAVGRLLADENLRLAMGRQAAAFVREKHDLNRNYGQVQAELERIAAQNKGRT